VGEHPARCFQIAFVIEEVTQEVKLLIGALAGNLCEYIAGVPTHSFVPRLRKVTEPGYQLLSPLCQLLLHQPHCLRVVVLEEAHNGVALSKHCTQSVPLKCIERKPMRASSRRRFMLDRRVALSGFGFHRLDLAGATTNR
jgi:hypothetical protein